MVMSENYILEMKNITKEFPGVKALDRVSFSVRRGEIHCLVGENGAGKSTLMKVLSGVYPFGTYSGNIMFNGELQQYRRISDSEKAGIAIIYQELALVPEMSVYENIFLGHEIVKNGTVDWNETIRRSNELIRKVGLRINPGTLVKELGVGKQQLVEIAKALSRDVKVLILDEPTAALNEADCDNLLQLIRNLKEEHGVTSIMISHKLKEVISIADTVTVLRDGQTICTLDAAAGEVSENILIKHMVGREIQNVFPPRDHVISPEVILEVKKWSAFNVRRGKNDLTDVSFYLKKGEIIGFAGLMGSGRTELARSLFGNPDRYRISGEMKLNGEPKEFSHPEKAIEAGLAYVSEDRKKNGLILTQDVKQNITIANLREIASRFIVNDNSEIKAATEYKKAINIKTPSLEQQVIKLSGGNQQKVQIAKWLFAKPYVLILDEPTRGIDVGAKYEIYTIMNKLVEEGMSIIMISSELPEVLGMSDRVYVVSEGRITGELPVKEATQEKIMQLATN
jgi:putative multiple sugar transport system ATP-binding protein